MTGAEVSDLKRALCAEIDILAPEIVSVSRFLHEHPETAFQEYLAHDHLTRFAADHGLSVTPHAYGLETAFLARAGVSGEAPAAAICVEYDALPGMGHGCGHNIIAAAGLGAAAVLAGKAGGMGGRLIVVGTPAEEGGAGKAILAEHGAFDHAGIAVMVHPACRDARGMDTLANRQFHATFIGKEAHASGAPWEGRNALDAAVLGYMAVAALRQHLPPGDQAHGIFVKGGDRPNIVPRETVMHWYIRSKTSAALETLRGRITACLEAGAQGAGCEVSFSFSEHSYHEMIENQPLLDAFIRNAALVGREYPETAPDAAIRASTDMGNVSVRVPSIHPLIGIRGASVPLHSPEFAEAAASPEGDRAAIDGAKILAMTVADFWGSAGLRREIAEAFHAS